jgi:anti-sigma28 factor (negative regulator of flagellin synthesis)
MRKPHNRKSFRPNSIHPGSQPMLMRRRRFRYDDALSTAPWSDETGPDFDAQELDMDVTGAGAISGAAPIRPTHLTAANGVDAPGAAGIEAPQDEVQISSAARALGEIDAGTQIHEARLAEIRAAIADGSYDSFDKLDAAVDRLIEALRRTER